MKVYSRRVTRGVFVLFLIVVFAVCNFVGNTPLALEKNAYKSLDILCDIISIIQKDYIEEVKSEKLIHNALKGMLASLDNYSHFIPASDKQKKPEADAQAEDFATYGLEVVNKGRLPTVISPIENGPAWKAGLKPGDKIIKINEKAVTESPLTELIRPFRGHATEELRLKVLREGERDFIAVVLKPGKIEGPAARSEKLGENIGLVRISRFDKGTPALVAEQLGQLKKDGVDSLVIDLRNCPAGEIRSAIEIADYLLPVGGKITSVVGRIEGVQKEFVSKGKPIFEEGPAVALINSGTSGAAEVLAGALKSQRRALLMGQNSFGSAFVEGTFPLQDGSSIMIITGVYQTPTGRVIQDNGLEVEIEVKPEPPKAAEKDVEKKSDKEETKQETKKEEKSLDPMIERAIDLIKAIRLTKA